MKKKKLPLTRKVKNKKKGRLSAFEIWMLHQYGDSLESLRNYQFSYDEMRNAFNG